MLEFTVYAPAKLNLYLDIIDRRPDGYHNIETLFEKIDLKDEIIIREKKQKGIEVRTGSGNCPSGKTNIVYKALEALFKEAGKDLGLEVTIKKNIPTSAGLAGGSSDAASVLRSVNDIFALDVKKDRLLSIASLIGKDVPFFMLDNSFAIGTATGEALETLDIDWGFYHVIVKPPVDISTKEMYKRFDSHKKREKGPDIDASVSALRKNDLALLKNSYYNIFEGLLGDYSDRVEKAKSALTASGADQVFLSGSGPSVFCVTKGREEAMKIRDRIPKDNSMEMFIAASYKGGIYGDHRG